MSVPIVDAKGKKVGQADIPTALNEVKKGDATVHQAVRTFLAAGRAGTHATKTKGMVRGGGRKPWRQKGTGRARTGSIRQPNWTGGGTVFGPQPRSYEMAFPKKMRRLAMRQVFADRIGGERVTVAQGFGVKEGRVKEGRSFLSGIKEEGKVLLVVESHDDLTSRAFRNLPDVRIAEPAELNVYDILWADRMVIQESAWDQVGEVIS